MLNRRQFAVAFVAATFALGVAVAQSPSDAPAVHKQQYAVYFSPGPDEAIRWGGYHVTVTGYSNSHAPGKSQKAILSKAWHKVFGGAAYDFSKAKEGGRDGYVFSKQSAKDGWRVDFKNSKLDELEQYLKDHGFKKAGSTRHKPYWHISLYGKDKKDARHKFNHLKEKGWRLWLVPRDGPWEKIE